MTTINFGDECTDGITGFSGIVTGLCSYITGCDQVLLAPRVAEDGSKRSSEWFDVDRLEVNKKRAFSLPKKTSNGPDLPAPIK